MSYMQVLLFGLWKSQIFMWDIDLPLFGCPQPNVYVARYLNSNSDQATYLNI